MRAKAFSIAMMVSLFLGSASVLAETTTANWCNQPAPHPADATFEAAMERSGGVTVDMRDAQGNAYVAWDAELNRIYRAILQQRPKRQVEALRRAQRAWLAWDIAETVSDREMTSEGGTSGPLAVAGLSIERRRARVCTLQHVLDDEDP